MTAGRKVVVIEDDDSLQKALKRLLDAGGFQAVAYTSAEALFASGSDPCAACVVSDLRLPGISGLDLLAALRARGEGVPLVLITAHDAPGLREEAAQRGAAAYLAKPFLGTELLAVIREAIASAGSRCRQGSRGSGAPQRRADAIAPGAGLPQPPTEAAWKAPCSVS